MCASYHSKLEGQVKFKNLTLNVPDSFRIEKFVHPRDFAPVLVLEEGLIKIQEMMFSMVPSWSKDSKVKFATHNARLDTIDTKPTWKIPFQKYHCLVPMSNFVEPVYEGPFAGNMIKFSDEGDQTLFAAGIYDTWLNRETGEVLQSFSVITHDPPTFVLENGHDRCPLFLSHEGQLTWLEAINQPSVKLKLQLLSNTEAINFKIEVQRPLKAGWKR